MKIGLVPNEVPPCLWHRARFAGEYLASQGEIEFKMLDKGPTVRYANRSSGPEPVGIVNLDDIRCDVIVFVRGIFPGRIVDLIPLLQRENIKCCVDLDDAYDRLPPSLANLYRVNPSLNPNYNWQHVRRAARLADLVTVSTPALMHYSEKSVVVRNCIPDHYLDIHAPHLGSVVGWGGVVAGHVHDLQMCRSGVVEALGEVGGKFLNVGDGVKVMEQLGLKDVPDATGIVPFERYPYELAKFDVAIAPLELNSYSEAKSNLKMIESLSLGSAVVASPTAEYVRLHKELEAWCGSHSPVPTAIATSKGRIWRRELLKALRRPENEREEIARTARQFIRERYLVSSRAYEFADAWEKALRS